MRELPGYDGGGETWLAAQPGSSRIRLAFGCIRLAFGCIRLAFGWIWLPLAGSGCLWLDLAGWFLGLVAARARLPFHKRSPRPRTRHGAMHLLRHRPPCTIGSPETCGAISGSAPSALGCAVKYLRSSGRDDEKSASPQPINNQTISKKEQTRKYTGKIGVTLLVFP